MDNKKIKNYEENVATFEYISELKSDLKYGNFDNIKKPWITVFIPTYKRTNLLEEAINSVLGQHHCDFEWDIVVLDNEADDGKVNDTEKLIRRINSKRILYYRNDKHVRPGDNFNRGFQLARGEWICFLHDDDLLISSSLQNIGELIKILPKYSNKPLGAISARYHQFTYLPDKKTSVEDLSGLNAYYSAMPVNYGVYRLTHSNLWFTANIGGDVPSNGTTFNRKAAIECGGFNEDFGISGDLILFYRMENKYSVYASSQPLGLYRWGNNTMIKPESTRRVIKDGYDFREYVYSKNIISNIGGKIFRRCHYKQFSSEVIEAKNRSLGKNKKIQRKDYCLDKVSEPSRVGYFMYVNVWQKLYYAYKGKECARLNKMVQHDMRKKRIREDLYDF